LFHALFVDPLCLFAELWCVINHEQPLREFIINLASFLIDVQNAKNAENLLAKPMHTLKH